jgi:hypothetical protein
VRGLLEASVIAKKALLRICGWSATSFPWLRARSQTQALVEEVARMEEELRFTRGV